MPWTVDLSGQQVFFRLIAAVVAITLHGLFTVLLARALGDNGPRYDGRMTLNPFRHVDPIGLLAAFFTQFGWSRPPRLTPSHMRLNRFGIVLVVVLSLLAMLAVAKGLWLLRPVAFSLLPASSAGVVMVGLLERTAELSIYLVIVNLVPIPPLAMGLLIQAIAPDAYGWIEKRMLAFAIGVGLLCLFWLGPTLAGPARQFARVILST